MAKAPVEAPAPLAGAFDVGGFRSELLRWFNENARDLPWRKTLEPYHVWLSEIMLQQTQMDRAVSYFERFLLRYPDIVSLAQAHEDEVLKLWEGLGYYTRAKNLLRAARVVLKEHGGTFPANFEAVRALPGVGPYTAGAVMSVAYGAHRPAVDANVERVFSRVLDIDRPVSAPEVKRRILAAAWELLPPGESRAFNQGLMELGALICAPRSAECQRCPVSRHCLARARGTVNLRPVPKPKPEVVRVDMACGILLTEGQVFIQKRRPNDVWPGLWEFPGGVLEPGESPEEAMVREFREETELSVRPEGKIAVVRTSYTRYRITLHGFFCRAEPGQDPKRDHRLHEAVEARLVSPTDLLTFAFPSGHARLTSRMLEDVRLQTLLSAVD
ncbi:MAG: A/G-specific adenine glycosylase [Humidesulfovibrio sp.]|uniref:A/G-specific adenine glycosylase n=1 Tax=Humidesulfovibrio sp. TaxID=2910988 RepID=UPI0027E760BA|nr:A/G-specific adenine glycosylase [Humidesulfovibrio sp.]MDQ7834107.1 A/G-specific adenine glycosylase [Humidesulfovibrio sp.]